MWKQKEQEVNTFPIPIPFAILVQVKQLIRELAYWEKEVKTSLEYGLQGKDEFEGLEALDGDGRLIGIHIYS